jgi:hypothetical protein
MKGDEAISAARKAERLKKNTPVAFLKHLNRELLLCKEKQDQPENEIASQGSQRRQKNRDSKLGNRENKKA